MPASIVLVGIGASLPNPGNYLELDFAQGPAGGFGQVRSILLMGNKTTSGTATNDTVVYGPDTQIPCQSEADVITLFGAGSQLHRMFRRATKVNPTATYYLLAIAPSAGAAATASLVLTNAATSNGNLRFWCVDEFVDTAITSGDSITTIGANLATSINSQTSWPITASNGAGTVTITAKNLGPEGNWIRRPVGHHAGHGRHRHHHVDHDQHEALRRHAPRTSTRRRYRPSRPRATTTSRSTTRTRPTSGALSRRSTAWRSPRSGCASGALPARRTRWPTRSRSRPA